MLGIGRSSSAFPKEIRSALEKVCELSSTIVEAICGTDARAKDVAERFGLHAKLGWQIWNVAHAEPLSAYRFLPNDHGIKVWRLVAIARGVPEDLFGRLESAIREVRQLMEVHASDQEMFEMLIDAQAEQTLDESEIKWRKQAFMGNSFVFGARAKCMLNTAILYPDATPRRFSMVRMNALLGLIRTRIGVRWPIATLVVQQPDGTDTAPKREPLFPSNSRNDVPFMLDYCSQPLPEVERRSDGETLIDELIPGLVGLTGACTVFTGEILHNVGPTHGMGQGEVAHFGTGVRTPSELAICDHIVHRSVFPGMPRELRVYSELVSPTARDQADALEVSEKLEHLGTGLHRVLTADVPHYGEILARAFERIGFDPNDFDVYRVRMKYPPIPASVMVKHPLPPPPAR